MNNFVVGWNSDCESILMRKNSVIRDLCCFLARDLRLSRLGQNEKNWVKSLTKPELIFREGKPQNNKCFTHFTTLYKTKYVKNEYKMCDNWVENNKNPFCSPRQSQSKFPSFVVVYHRQGFLLAEFGRFSNSKIRALIGYWHEHDFAWMTWRAEITFNHVWWRLQSASSWRNFLVRRQIILPRNFQNFSKLQNQTKARSLIAQIPATQQNFTSTFPRPRSVAITLVP